MHIIKSNTIKFNSLTVMLLVSLAILLSYNVAEAKIFDPVNADKSVEYLGMIFGNKIGSLNLSQGEQVNHFLSNLFQIFNGLILSVAISILTYVSFISTINTAQEGQIMGKKWSSIWIPLRSTLGLLLLAPVPGSGYSSLQVFIMWIVLNGVGAADYLWNFVLNNLSQGISIIEQEEIHKKDLTSLNKHGREFTKKIFKSLICNEIFNHRLNINWEANHLPNKLNFYFTEPSSDPHGNNIVFRLNFGIENAINQELQTMCGSFEISTKFAANDLLTSNQAPTLLPESTNKQITDFAHHTKLSMITKILNDTSIVASFIAQSAHTDPISNNVMITTNDENLPGCLYRATQEYNNAMTTLTKQAVANLIGLPTLGHQEPIANIIINKGKDFGWITAGSYYYLLTKGTAKHLIPTALEEINLITKPLLYEEPNQMKARLEPLSLTTTNKLQSYRIALEQKKSLVDNLFIAPNELNLPDTFMHEHDHSQSRLPLDPKVNNEFLPKINALLEKFEHKKINDFIKPYITDFAHLNDIVLKDIQNCLSGKHEDPLISQATFGVELMQLAEDFWITIINDCFNPKEPGKATELDIKNNNIKTTLLIPILIIGGIIWGIGASFSVYMPMIPYMMFIVAALGWFLLVIEAIIASPIIALGFIMPSQDELGKIAPALGILANVFLKPMLIVLGLIMAAKLYSAVVAMVNLGFKFSFAALHLQIGTTTFSWIVILILYSSFIITLINKCYSLVYQIPDKILRWIGITGEQTDIAAVKETQQSFDQGAKQGLAPIEGSTIAAANKLKGNTLAIANKHYDPSGLTSIGERVT